MGSPKMRNSTAALGKFQELEIGSRVLPTMICKCKRRMMCRVDCEILRNSQVGFITAGSLTVRFLSQRLVLQSRIRGSLLVW